MRIYLQTETSLRETWSKILENGLERNLIYKLKKFIEIRLKQTTHKNITFDRNYIITFHICHKKNFYNSSTNQLTIT